MKVAGNCLNPDILISGRECIGGGEGRSFFPKRMKVFQLAVAHCEHEKHLVNSIFWM